MFFYECKRVFAGCLGNPHGYPRQLDYSDPSDRCTNNTTEYEALLLGLRKVRVLGASNFLVKCDAEVIKDHVEKESEAREPELVKYLAEE
jgi:ribonuclease HI